jgi:hypothetical protein
MNPHFLEKELKESKEQNKYLLDRLDKAYKDKQDLRHQVLKLNGVMPSCPPKNEKEQG